MKRLIFSFLLSFLFSLSALSQGNFTVNQKVEVLWKGRWYKATVLTVNGSTYQIHYDGYASSWDETVPKNRIRSINSESRTGASVVKYGKYNCTALKYSNGAV